MKYNKRKEDWANGILMMLIVFSFMLITVQVSKSVYQSYDHNKGTPIREWERVEK